MKKMKRRSSLCPWENVHLRRPPCTIPLLFFFEEGWHTFKLSSFFLKMVDTFKWSIFFRGRLTHICIIFNWVRTSHLQQCKGSPFVISTHFPAEEKTCSALPKLTELRTGFFTKIILWYKSRFRSISDREFLDPPLHKLIPFGEATSRSSSWKINGIVTLFESSRVKHPETANVVSRTPVRQVE